MLGDWGWLSVEKGGSADVSGPGQSAEPNEVNWSSSGILWKVASACLLKRLSMSRL